MDAREPDDAAASGQAGRRREMEGSPAPPEPASRVGQIIRSNQHTKDAFADSHPPRGCNPPCDVAGSSHAEGPAYAAHPPAPRTAPVFVTGHDRLLSDQWQPRFYGRMFLDYYYLR